MQSYALEQQGCPYVGLAHWIVPLVPSGPPYGSVSSYAQDRCSSTDIGRVVPRWCQADRDIPICQIVSHESVCVLEVGYTRIIENGAHSTPPHPTRHPVDIVGSDSSALASLMGHKSLHCIPTEETMFPIHLMAKLSP